MNKFSKALLAIFVLGSLSLGCGLITVAEDISTRIPNPAPLELWVATSGNDANDCVSVGTPCLTLHAAYDKSTTSSTIHIGAGEFIEERGINLNNGITLVGAGRDQTIIRAVSGNYVLEVGGWRDVTIRDLSIIGRDGGDVDVGFVDVGPYDDGPIGINVSGGASGGVLIENCRVTENITGIRIQYPASIVTINNCVIEDNYNGVLNSGGLSMRSTTLQHNAAGPGRYRARWATMVFGNASDALASVTDGTFDSNGVDGEVSFTIENKGNMSLVGGTILHNNGEVRNEGGVLSLDHVELIENYNSGITFMGSRIADIGGKLTIKSSIIKDSDGAGVDMYGEFGDHGDLNISQTAIIGNHEGGLMLHAGEFTLSVENTTISGNLTKPGTGLAAGIFLSGGELSLIHSTVAFNEGVGVAATGSAVTTGDGSVVALNTGEECIRARFSDTGIYTCNEVWTPQASELGLGPLTLEAGTWVHPLLPGSPLIDRTSLSTCPPNDQRGFARPVGVACDVGAYEYVGGSTVAPLEFVTPSGGVPGVVPLYTDTPAPKTPIILTFTKNAFCRKGPSALYRDISSFKLGDTAQADARNDDDSRWWWVQIPNSTKHCWVSHITVVTNDLAEGLPIQPTDSLELPEIPSDFVISQRICSQNGYALKLAWTASVGAEGYSLYRNGEEIAAFKAHQTVYQENPPINKPLLYELEAFNDNGFSERLSVEDSCP